MAITKFSRQVGRKLLPRKHLRFEIPVLLGRVWLSITTVQIYKRKAVKTLFSHLFWLFSSSVILFMEKMTESFCNLKIENKPPKFFKTSSEETQKQYYLMGKVCTEKLKIGACMSFLRSIWRLSDQYQIQYRKTNKLLFSFHSEKDRERIYNGGPWNFEHSLIVLNKVDGKTQVDTIPIHKQEFWVQIHGFPPHYLIHFYADQIKQMDGDITEIDIPKNGISRYPFLRCRRWVDVNEPLDRFGDFKTDDGKIHSLHFFYEALPRFCYLCGRLTHGISLCPEKNSVDRSAVLPFGDWLRTDNPNNKKKEKKTGGSSRWGKNRQYDKGESSSNAFRKPGFSNSRDEESDLAMVPIDDERSGGRSSESSCNIASGVLIPVAGELNKRERRLSSSASENAMDINTKPVFMASAAEKGKGGSFSEDGVHHLKSFRRLKSNIVIQSAKTEAPILLLTETPSGSKRAEEIAEERCGKKLKFFSDDLKETIPTEKAREAMEPPCQE